MSSIFALARLKRHPTGSRISSEKFVNISTQSCASVSKTLVRHSFSVYLAKMRDETRELRLGNFASAVFVLGKRTVLVSSRIRGNINQLWGLQNYNSDMKRLKFSKLLILVLVLYLSQYFKKITLKALMPFLEHKVTCHCISLCGGAAWKTCFFSSVSCVSFKTSKVARHGLMEGVLLHKASKENSYRFAVSLSFYGYWQSWSGNFNDRKLWRHTTVLKHAYKTVCWVVRKNFLVFAAL